MLLSAILRLLSQKNMAAKMRRKQAKTATVTPAITEPEFDETLLFFNPTRLEK